MIYHNVDLHNVAQLVDEPTVDGLRIQRVPESTRLRLEERAQAAVLNPDSCEIRFVLEGDDAQITLSTREAGTTVTLFYGPFHSRQQWALSEEPLTITVSRPKNEALLATVAADAVVDSGFSPRVCRLVFWWRGVAGDLGLANLHFVDGRSILTDVSGLSADLIHPSDLGMITMGENMAKTIGGLL